MAKTTSTVKIKKTNAAGWKENGEDILSLDFNSREKVEFIIKSPSPKNKQYIIRFDSDGVATIEPYKK